MGDKLEKFIFSNREDFDSEVPGDRVWTHIQSELKPKRTAHWWWKAAAVLFFASTSYLLIEKKLISTSDTPGAEMEMAEFSQAEDYYLQLITQKRTEIEAYDAAGMEQEFLLEIDRLDRMYTELKKTYKKQHSTELVVDAMISNLRLRADILDQQIRILEKLKEAKNESDTSIEI